MSDPFARLNQAHRDHIDSPWPSAQRNQFRQQWQTRPRHLDAADFDSDPLLVRLGRWLAARRWIFILIGLLAGGWFAARAIYAAVAWHWQ